jgi:hypothetical protein
VTAEIIVLPGRTQEIAEECQALLTMLAFLRALRKTLNDQADELCGPDVPRAEALVRLRCFKEALAGIEADYQALCAAVRDKPAAPPPGG